MHGTAEIRQFPSTVSGPALLGWLNLLLSIYNAGTAAYKSNAKIDEILEKGMISPTSLAKEVFCDQGTFDDLMTKASVEDLEEGIMRTNAVGFFMNHTDV